MSRTLHWILRGLTLLAGVDGLTQAMFAGRFMSGSYRALDAHSLNGLILGVISLLLTIAFGIAWRSGAPSWTFWTSLGLTLACGIEIMLGHKAILAIHVPLGVLIIAGFLALLVQAWRTPVLVGANALGDR
ncbi:MAG: hypothetical protein JWN03_2282 [Nocardia sp.]|uniref:hypothetical protein n=1 Tax=Nocardia sp. TaxID=1821 RepID=UPI002638B361|nr:hypothetical protein [Nocardia sp.]MCU1642007.1 hypothetical protein [Nocardia sp.]